MTSRATVLLTLLAATACTPPSDTKDGTPRPDPNEAPGAPQIAMNAASPATDADLVVVFLAQSADTDGDTVTYRYTWFQDGAVRADLTTDTVNASETAKGQIWRVVVTPNDGELDGAVAEASATIVNTPPVAQVTVNAAARTDDDLVAMATSTDTDGDAVTFAYAWTRDGEAQADLTGTSVPAARTAHGEVWTVSATPNDGEANGAPVTASVTIANTAPTVASVSLTPSAPRTDETLLATVEGAEDADGDTIAFTYTWYVDDVAVQSGADDTLRGDLFAKHQLVRVEVVPDDGMDTGASVMSDDALAVNTAPRGTGASVSPSALVEASTATCAPTGWTDVDGDAEAWTYAWLVNGSTVSTASTLDGASFSKGDVVTCVATPTDGEASGPALTASSVRVANTAPTLASVALSTTAPTEADTVSVTVSGEADADGDTVSLQYAWQVNGVLVSTSSTLTPSRFAKGDRIDLTVTPFDGTDLGTAVSASTAIVADSPPVVTSVSLTPSAPTTNSVLTANAVTTDADGDRVSVTYAWTVNGVPTGTTGSTLNGAVYFDRDDVVAVSVTPNDGERDGAAVTSSSVTVRNTAPTTPGVGIEPSVPTRGDTLTCNVTTPSSDTDGDRISYEYRWMVDGVDAGVTTGNVDGTRVGSHEVWTCEVTATDGTDRQGPMPVSVTVEPICSLVAQEDWNDGSYLRWSNWSGSYTSTASSELALLRTATQWAGATQSISVVPAEEFDISANLKLSGSQSQVGMCITDGSASGLWLDGVSWWGNGYCIALSNETQNGSTSGAFLLYNRLSNNSGGDASGVLIRDGFTPSIGRQYLLRAVRSAGGMVSLYVDGVLAGSAVHGAMSTIARVGLFAGQDTSAGYGGNVDDVEVYSCE